MERAGGAGSQLLVYLMSFVTLGIFWMGQQTQLNNLEKSDRDLTWIHLGFLFTVTLLPFTTRLLADFIEYRAALLVYWLNIVLFGIALYASWGWARRASLMKANLSVDFQKADLIASSLGNRCMRSERRSACSVRT